MEVKLLCYIFYVNIATLTQRSACNLYTSIRKRTFTSCALFRARRIIKCTVTCNDARCSVIWNVNKYIYAKLCKLWLHAWTPRRHVIAFYWATFIAASTTPSYVHKYIIYARRIAGIVTQQNHHFLHNIYVRILCTNKAQRLQTYRLCAVCARAR